jgi:hypothetical protein
MTKKPETYPLRYVSDFSASPTKLQSNYRNAQQEVIFHHPASLMPVATTYYKLIVEVAPRIILRLHHYRAISQIWRADLVFYNPYTLGKESGIHVVE